MGFVMYFAINFQEKKNLPSRLDKFFISEGLIVGFSEVLHVASLSDHCGLQMSIKLDVEISTLPRKERRTYRKQNTSILEEEEFFPNFVTFWERISDLRGQFVDLAEWWDKLAKPEIPEFFVGV